MNKPYKFAVVIGRFQPLHFGHLSIISKALEQAETVAIYIGSSNNTGTSRNPYDYLVRLNMIYGVADYFYFDSHKKIYIKPLKDREEIKDDSAWGKYFLDCIKEDFGAKPDLLVQGADEERNNWFTKEDMVGIDILSVSRDNIDISATKLRQMLIDDKYEEFCKYTPWSVHRNYTFLRNKLIQIIEGEKKNENKK